MTAVYDVLHALFSNVSVFVDKSLGEALDSQQHDYDGCLGRLQRNQSDISSLTTAIWPTTAPGLTSLLPMLSLWSNSWSYYNASHDNFKAKATDALDAFSSLSPMTWLLTFVAIVCITGLMLTGALIRGRRRRRKRRSRKRASRRHMAWSHVTKTLTGCLVKQLSSYAQGVRQCPRRSALLLLILFTFLLHFYFCSMIKTDAVVFNEPDTISTVDDILARPQLMPLWTTVFHTRKQYESADPHSKIGLIWKRALHFGLDKCVVYINANNVVYHMIRLARHEAVLLCAEHGNTDAAIAFMCGLAVKVPQLKDMRAWLKTDEVDGYQKMHAFPVSVTGSRCPTHA